MEFYNQSWFWSLSFAALTSLASLGCILIKGCIDGRYKLKSERIKIYETKQFNAYDELYKFITYAYSFYPPSVPILEYRELMMTSYFKNAKSNMLYYPPEIRKLLSEMEKQHDGLDDPDYIGRPFDDFLRNDFLNILDKMKKIIEEKSNELFHKN